MKLAIVSDSHDNQVNIKKVVDWLNRNNFKYLIHCGDVADLSSLKLFEKFQGQIFLVLGNADQSDLETYKARNLKIFADCGHAEINGFRAAFCHKEHDLANCLKEKGFDIGFYGHSHLPMQKLIEISGRSVMLVNPGNLAGMFALPTFAVYDLKTKKLSLKMVHDL